MVVLVLSGAASAQDAGAEATVYAGLEVGNTDTHRLDAGARLQFREHWNANVQLSRARFELPDGDVTSTVAGAGLQRKFGDFGAGLGYRSGELSDVSRSNSWVASAFLRRHALRFSAEVELRGTELAPAPFTEDLGTGAGVQSGTSRCDVDSVGYQAQIDVDRPAWAAFVSFKAFDYDAFDCLLAIAGGAGNGNGPPAHARGRALGRRLGEAALQPVSGFASRLVPREAMLLQTSLSLGVTLPIDEHWIGGAEFYRDREQAGDSGYRTALLFANRRLDDTWSVEFSVGFSDADQVEDTTFAGLRVSADL
jgi:hypothetical protein